MDVEIRTFVMNDDGSIDPKNLVPFEYYGASPNVGDTVYDEILTEPRCYSVQRRFLIQIPECPIAWAILVRKIEVPPSLATLITTWKEDDAAAAAAEDEPLKELIRRGAKTPAATGPKTRLKKKNPPRKTRAG